VVLPELDRALGGAARPSIARAAALAREDADWLDQLADEQAAILVTELPGRIEVDAPSLIRQPRPVARRIVLKALRTMAGGREVGQDHVDAILAVSAGESGGIDVPGGRVELRRGKLVLIEQKAASK